MRRFSFRLLTLLPAIVVPMVAGGVVRAQDDDEAQMQHYHRVVRPVLAKHCFSCHNGGDLKGGLNLEDVYFVVSIIRRGERWAKAMDLIEAGEMPPPQKPRMSDEEKRIVLDGIGAILDKALDRADPGQVVMRRLSNREYRYTVFDLLGVDFDARGFFPADGSGGEGFDNQARVLYLSSLLLERYYEAAEQILDEVYDDPDRRRRVVPRSYTPSWRDRLWVWWRRAWHGEDRSLDRPLRAAREVLYPFATRAYRRFPTEPEKQQLTDFFAKVYLDLDGAPDRFDRSVFETLKLVLVSPHFLYRREADLPLAHPYPIGGFELASRLSYFLWSSLPDDELLEVAYRQDLHDPAVLEAQVERMLRDPKSVRLAESFATQWLEIDDLLDVHEIDAERFPGFSDELRRAMVDETVATFHHVLTERRTFLDLLDSDYAFLNEPLAAHYGIGGSRRTGAAQGGARRPPARGCAGHGQRAHGHLAADPHQPGAARHVGARPVARHPASPASARRARARIGQGRRRRRARPPRTAPPAPGAVDLPRLPSEDGPARPRPRELRRRRPLARALRRRAHRRHRRPDHR